VLALTNDDRANLAVAMAVRLLEPNLPVLARAMTRDTAANMASFGTDHIINPFARFGEQLALAISAPANYRLVSWLTALPGTMLEPERAPPHGAWVVCGYGRFGREVVRAFHDQHGLRYTILRPFNAIGPEEEAGDEVGDAHVIPDLVKKIRGGQHPVELLGDAGNNVRAMRCERM
jgi:voltage-gated potassium channel